MSLDGADPSTDLPGPRPLRGCEELGGPTRVLYFAPVGGAFERFLGDVSCCPDVAPVLDAPDPTLTLSGEPVVWSAVTDAPHALEALERTYVHAILVDLRCRPDEAGDFPRRVAAALELIDALDRARDVELRYGFHRILVLLSGPQPARVDDLIATLGLRGVGHVLRDHDEATAAAGPDAATFARRALRETLRLVHARTPGKRALCAAGGGITGIYFELGALKCLDDVLPPGALQDFDMYFGISAGAVVTSYLANGYAVEEVMAAVAGLEGGRVPPLDLRLFSLRHLDTAELRARAALVYRTALDVARGVVRDRRIPGLDALLYRFGKALSPPFSALGFADMLRASLQAPGACNDFRRLPHPLYVGATDQDARAHVLFGTPGHDHVPIHLAVAGSISFNPAFGSTVIEGRRYEDGAVTRTSNFEEAIRRGARFVVVLDPFVPYVSRDPGYAASQGMLYNVDQNVRTISYTRFENARNWILRKHPEVSSYTFLPSNTQRHLLSVNPMDHRPYLPIWKAAYLSTLRRIHQLCHRLRGDLRVYGLPLDTARAEAVADRLEATDAPTFADFFPDGQVRIRRPPLVLEAGAAERAERPFRRARTAA